MIAGKGHQTNAVVPVRDLSGGNILASSIMDDPFLYYNESLTQNRDETRIATVQNFREFVSHYPQEVILNAQPNQIKEKSYENIVIVFLAVLLVISSMIIIKLLCLRQNCLKNAAQVVVPTEAESFSNTGHATDRENSAAPVSLKDEKVVEDNKHHGAELVPYKNINERLEPEIIDITPRKGSHQSTYRMIENKEYTLEKEPGAGIVKTTKQEIKEYFPEEAEPELLEEAKVISEKLGAEFDPQKVQLRNNKLTVGISTQRTADSCEVEAKSFYAIFTNRENARSVENNRFTKTFDCIELLGAGGFAEVYKARYILDGKFYAVKRIVMQHDFKESVKKRKAYREIYALQTFDHPYIVRYVTCWIEIPTSGTLLNTKAIPLVDTKNNSITESNAPVTQELGFEWDRQDDDSNTSKTLSKKLVCTSSNKDITLKEESPLQSVIQRTVPPPKVVLGSNTIDLTFYIQMVLYPKTLKDYLTERGSEIEPRRNLKYFTQIISALQEIHSKGLIHRDMKPANIFLDQDDNVKVGDFGLAVKMSEEGESPLSDELENRSVGAHTENVGTKQYLPPEQESGYYSEKVDIYATGLILMELCCTFSTGHERNLAFEGLKNKRVLPEAFDIRKYREEGELVMKMTETDPDERPSAVDVIDLLAYKRLIKRVKSQQGFIYYTLCWYLRKLIPLIKIPNKLPSMWPFSFLIPAPLHNF
eukprot:TRINITY_DN1249_c0_g1_i1.p1 TRINITY_DN1249_c0_g1~~TRINITY_DN1249_c0_g1_i1.p1  ORF type:complete len:705 (-),score=86.23 TRINITY_DN1249_c0_g1_i1:7323-9437(-)